MSLYRIVDICNKILWNHIFDSILDNIYQNIYSILQIIGCDRYVLKPQIGQTS